MDIDYLKKKLRNIKKYEKRLRGIASESGGKKLIWNDFFSTKDNVKVKYPFSILKSFDKITFEEVLKEYYYYLFYNLYKENGLNFNIYDPVLLSYMDLPPDASAPDIKKQFRLLAKKYHPDLGGSSDKMRQIIETYHKLIDK